MKIAFLTSSYPRFPGDIAGTFVQDIASELSRFGHEVHVLMPSDGRRPLQRAAPEGVFEHSIPYAPISKLRVLGYAKSLQADRRLNRLAYAMILPYVVSSFVQLRGVIQRLRCDVIHAHWVLPNGPAAGAVSRQLGVPLVISLHGSDVYVAERQRLFSLTARWAFRSADYVTACSRNLQQRSIRLGSAPERTVVIPYGASVERFASTGDESTRARHAMGLGDKVPLVFALGRLVNKKGFDVLLSAWPLVLRKFPEAFLAIGGDGPLASELESFVKSQGIADRVRLLGRVASSEVPFYMRACDVFVMPSVTDLTGNVDGLPVVVMEAMAAARPVVATRVGGMPEVIESGINGILVNERSPEALAAGLVQFLASPLEARACGERARTLVETQLSWSSVARRFESIYERAHSNRLSL